MVPDIERVKGIHPGAILKHTLKKRGIKNIDLAIAIDEHPQTLTAIAKERRGINAKLSYKLGNFFSIAEDYFMFLQAAYEVKSFRCSKKQIKNPLLGKFRPAIFWDTKLENIDYLIHKRSVIQRVLERGNREEIKNLIDIYSLEDIKKEISMIHNSFIPRYKENVQKYIH